MDQDIYSDHGVCIVFTILFDYIFFETLPEQDDVEPDPVKISVHSA